MAPAFECLRGDSEQFCFLTCHRLKTLQSIIDEAWADWGREKGSNTFREEDCQGAPADGVADCFAQQFLLQFVKSPVLDLWVCLRRCRESVPPSLVGSGRLDLSFVA